jgi:hypothetical protein
MKRKKNKEKIRAKKVSLLTYIWEVSGSNLGQASDYSDFVYWDSTSY